MAGPMPREVGMLYFFCSQRTRRRPAVTCALRARICLSAQLELLPASCTNSMPMATWLRPYVCRLRRLVPTSW